ncbi:Transcription initiation factor TFIID subunit 3 [Diplodia seriata]|uniref:Transcription initiation factor TFIID subunit 3 n=1 Tax=Diplodia seriata TaxID=420778 RepID=A0A1S8BJA2_9PEZI|nr:Transcription initiation factor TFIID subunit 3 [Diplodia seriata]
MAQELHAALLRPAILHILRAAGYHSARPSVVDAVSDVAARYMLLLAQRTAYHAWSNHNDADPTISDVRMALADAGMLVPSMTGAEEAWKELLRHPLEDFPERNGLRLKEQRRRDLEDTADVREFIDWITGPANREIMRIAGLERDAVQALKKKHSKTGEESRFQGTVLGIPADDRPIRIEGGPPESIHDWIQQTQERAAAAAKLESEKTASSNGLESAPRSPPTEKEDDDPMDVES